MADSRNIFATLPTPQRILDKARADGVDTSSKAAVERWLERKAK